MPSSLRYFAITGILLLASVLGGGFINGVATLSERSGMGQASSPVTLFMCGDVMTGRGIDQIMPHPSSPVLYESYMKNARGYVELAEKANGPILQPVSYPYIWGAALAELEQRAPDVRIINLETSVTRSDDYWKTKGIHYRMHPENIACLTAARIDYCSLANNHTLDWGYAGLRETLKSLHQAGIKSSGAGHDVSEAEKPAVIQVAGKGRVVIFAYGSTASGIPLSWAATQKKAGINLLTELSAETVHNIKQMVHQFEQPGDIIVISIHWGGNWGYRIRDEHIAFARQLIDEAGVDVIHGHSSHHIKGIEVYKGKPVIYGCGDFLNDYEGIGGYERFRSDLSLMYFISMDPATGDLVGMELIPTRIKNCRVNAASPNEMLWLKNILNRESERFGTKIEVNPANSLTVRWNDLLERLSE